MEAGTWEGSYDYVVVLVTAPKAVTEAVASARRGARINLFGGIPAQVRYRVDYDGLIEKECYVFGTSGSRVDDMEAVLAQIRAGRLDTNLSVDAVSGMAGAKEAMAALGANRWPGKIVVYPRLEKMELWSVGALGEKYPTVRTALARGSWTARAEAALLRIEG